MSRVTGGKHYTIEQKTLFLRMKELVVQYQNPAVYNSQMRECDTLSRLKGVATHCDFSVDCTIKEKVSYTNHITKFKLGSGLVDEEIKEVVLRGEEKTLEDTAKVTLGGGDSWTVS